MTDATKSTAPEPTTLRAGDLLSAIPRNWYKLNRGFRVAIVLMSTIVLWEVSVIVFDVKEFLVPRPTVVGALMCDDPLWMLEHTWHTFYETIIGFVLAVVFGVILAILIVSSRFLEETLYILLVTLNSVPKVAVAPLFVVWMGTGLSPKVAIAAMIAIFVIVIDMVLGLRSVDPEMIDLARSMKASKMKTLFKIRFPHALPNLFAGMKVAITLALIGSIVGEFVASDKGLGYVILVAQGQFDTPQMFVSIVLLAILGTVLFFLVDLAEKFVLPWHVSRRQEEGGADAKIAGAH